MAITCEDLNVQLNAKLKLVLERVAEGFKGYTDTSIADVKKTLTEEIVKELSGVEQLGKDLEKIKGYADSFAKVFDGNEDGTITPDEILAKATLLQQAIDGVNARLDKSDATFETYVKEVAEKFAELEDRIKALELNEAQNRDEIANVKADLSTNYISKDCVDKIVDIDVDNIVDSVLGRLNPTTEDGESAGDASVE